MNPPVPSQWTAVCATRDLRQRPLRFLIDATPIVVFRSAHGVAAFPDICPHRQAPLSLGRVTGGRIECAYHGWQFDGSGECRAMPGVVNDIPRVRIAPWQACEQDGLIFVAPSRQEASPYSGRLTGRGVARAFVPSRVQSTLAEVAENILDATHTHFIHRGLLRGLSAKRYRVRVSVTGGPGWVQARYDGEPQQEGLISRLLEGGRGISIGRFLAPGIAEIEFWGPQRANLCTTFHLRQETPDQVAGIGVLSGPVEYGLGYVKAALFHPLFAIAIAQDQRILSAAAQNRARFGAPTPVIGPLDILRRSIDAILRGDAPPVSDVPIVTEMEL